MPRTLLWQDLTSDEIALARDNHALVVVPVGAIEQHSAHLGTDTDMFLSTAVSRLAAARASALPVLVAPSLAFGFSPHHISHAGTISLRLSTYLAVLGDIATSLVNSGFRRVLFVNGHGGNSAPLRAAPAGNMVWRLLGSRLLALAIVLGMAFVLLASMALSVALSGAQDSLSHLFPGSDIAIRVVGGLVSFGILVGLIALLFKYVPDAKISWRPVWIGGFISAVLVVIG